MPFDGRIVEVDYEEKINFRFMRLSNEQLRKVVKSYEDRNFIARFFDPNKNIPEYRIAKELLHQRK